jgi:hypothetical protein
VCFALLAGHSLAVIVIVTDEFAIEHVLAQGKHMVRNGTPAVRETFLESSNRKIELNGDKLNMKEQNVTPAPTGARTLDPRAAERRTRHDRAVGGRFIDCGGMADGRTAVEVRAAADNGRRSTDRAPHGAGVYPEQHQPV